ncbi:MAG TPA: TRAP transporter small permease [Syntrophorhabdus sp.]|jgi:TRAP-type C4-dicarboxylate transport system permease small subunit|nr:TRAP transporter small permease [Syntrophorhabdus sp.]MDI9556981.1 TRAP transporter small permease [Pseudomonadota bacterium]OPX99051.1 MAG: Tripartite ATP-independent periplasmic transporter [Syntrophorhabdus sp. PtaB.Bin027]OQB75707.1 MAG: Tripartite ATP-independent periplasmic transporter [Deltaproteobacteria bacterium ADurb.Bin135]NMC94878.1 TRAP transporter small permease [Syntrophorhabdus sp.]
MEGLHAVILRISKVMDVVGGVVLSLMMLITVTDVILRFFGKPITGTYELVFLGGAIVIGCAIPQTSWQGGHVNVDLVLDNLPGMLKKIFMVFTRLLGIIFFAFLSWNLLKYGAMLFDKGEVSLTLHVPYYPVAYILSLCAFVECLVLLSGLIKTICEVNHE